MMRPWFFWLLMPLIAINSALAGSAPAPVRPGMRINFAYINARVEQKQFWSLSVIHGEFPGEITVGWVRPHPNQPSQSGKRIYTNLKEGRVFRPVFVDGENQAVIESTAPWLSQAVYQELRETGSASRFKEGGGNLMGKRVSLLKVEERVELPVRINGDQTFVKALKLNRGIWVWDNPLNPLVLKYEPFGFPLITGVVGWRVTELRY